MSTNTQEATRFDVVGFITAWEGGDPTQTEDEIVEGFQYLIDTGLAWQLQGAYGRAARAMIERGFCHLPEHQPAELIAGVR